MKPVIAASMIAIAVALAVAGINQAPRQAESGPGTPVHPKHPCPPSCVVYQGWVR